MREPMDDRAGGRGLSDRQFEVRKSGTATGDGRFKKTSLGKPIALVVATCYAVATFTGCALNKEYPVSANGVPLSVRYADAGETRTDASASQEERGWWGRNWPWVLLGVVALGGIAAAVVLLSHTKSGCQPPGGFCPAIKLQ